MEVEQPNRVMMTFDEVSMEQSIGFVKALQELKNLRPQLYSAAEYCEKSYLHSEQKQTVLDNLKDYAVRALVNAVDHLGTVAYKLTDLLDQQALEISSTELHVTCTPAANTLSWHLATETKSTLKGSSRPLMSIDDPKTSRSTPTSVHTSNGEEGMPKKSPTGHPQLANVGPASSTAMQTLGITRRDLAEGPKPMTPFRSFDNPKPEKKRTPTRSKSLLSAFFVKQKSPKQAISLKGSA
ncbi:ABI-1-like protein 1 [Tanacetum coccineum]